MSASRIGAWLIDALTERCRQVGPVDVVVWDVDARNPSVIVRNNETIVTVTGARITIAFAEPPKIDVTMLAGRTILCEVVRTGHPDEYVMTNVFELPEGETVTYVLPDEVVEWNF